MGFYATVQEEVRDPKTGRVLQHRRDQYFPPDPASIFFTLKNRKRGEYRDVHNVDVNARTLPTSLEALELIRQDILDLQADGFLKDVIPPQLLSPSKKTDGSGNGAG